MCMEYLEVANRRRLRGAYNATTIGASANIKRLINCIIESHLKRYLGRFCVLEAIICSFGAVNESQWYAHFFLENLQYMYLNEV